MIKLRWIEVTNNPPAYAIPIQTVTGVVYRVLQCKQEEPLLDENSAAEWEDVPIEMPGA